MAKLVTCKTCNTEVAKSAKACPKCGAPNPGGKTSAAAIVVGAVLLFVVVRCLSAVGDNATKASMASTPPIDIDAVDLLRAYIKNEVAADQQYKGRILLVRGNVDDMGKDLLDNIYASFTLPDTLRSVQAFFPDSQASEIAKLERGDFLAVRCRGDGLLGNVLLKDCTVVH